MNKKIELRGFADCRELIGKRVSFNYSKTLRTGIVKDFEQEGRKVYFQILSDMTKCITHVNMFDLVEITDKVIEDDKKIKFIIK